MIVQKAKLESMGSEGLEMEGGTKDAIDHIMRHFFSEAGHGTLVLKQDVEWNGGVGTYLKEAIVLTIDKCNGEYTISWA